MDRENLNWLRTEFGQEHFMKIRTVTPTKDFFKRTFDGTEKDAEFILERTMELMNIQDVDITLTSFPTRQLNFPNHFIYTL